MLKGYDLLMEVGASIFFEVVAEILELCHLLVALPISLRNGLGRWSAAMHGR